MYDNLLDRVALRLQRRRARKTYRQNFESVRGSGVPHIFDGTITVPPSPGGGLVAKGARVGRATTQAIGAFTWTSVQFTTETYDTDSMHDNAVNNSRVSAPVNGIYVITAGGAFPAGIVGDGYRIILDGSTVLATRTLGVAVAIDETLATEIQLNAGQYIELQAYAASGAGGTVPASVHLEMVTFV